MQVYEKLLKCRNAIEDRIPFTPKIALVLGTGLGDYADSMEIVSELPYGEIEGFPTSTVQGHKGRFLFGYVGGVPVVVMQGRVHYYEGYPIDDVVLPIRLMGLMGAKVLFLTNSSGGLNFSYSAGDFMLIIDHISCFVPSPLIGPNIDEIGTRFPDMSRVYSQELRSAIHHAADKNSLKLHEGVYIQLTGPNFETPSEVRMCRVLGGDVVGMSTACEAIAARHMGMQVCGISCVSNLGCGMTNQPLTHDEVQETGDRVAPVFKMLVTASIAEIAKLI